MILLLDIGNSRLKWAQLDGGVLGPQFAAVHTNVDRAHLLERLFETSSAPERVLISNVGGAEIGSFCVAAIRGRWAVEPNFVQSSRELAGVTNAYVEPEKLGVDRWLSVIAAHAMGSGAACVVGVGTAMTVDGVDVGGRHLGGVIVPGPHLMISSLLQNTSEIAGRMTDDSAADSVFATHTHAAVHRGCAQALAGLVDRAMAEMQRDLGSRPRLIVTGGASEIISPLIGPHEIVPDLVLRGLAVLAEKDQE